MEEVWKEIPGWPGYEVSNHGRVFGRRLNRILKISFDRRGYPRVYLNRTGKPQPQPVHRLVAMLFVEGYFDGAVVNHKDGNKRNNFAHNLEWVTSAQNVRHAWQTGLSHGDRIVSTYDPKEEKQ